MLLLLRWPLFVPRFVFVVSAKACFVFCVSLFCFVCVCVFVSVNACLCVFHCSVLFVFISLLLRVVSFNGRCVGVALLVVQCSLLLLCFR